MKAMSDKTQNKQNSPNFFTKMDLKPVINGQSWVTRLGGSIMPPAVLQSMADASSIFVDIVELNKKAGEIIARHTTAEAGIVTAGCSSAQLLQAAACITGCDANLIGKLPNTRGLSRNIVIQKSHENHYDTSYKFAGAKLVSIGSRKFGATIDQLIQSITSETVAIAFIWHLRFHGLSFEEVVEVAHSKNIPVIVDAAAELPPVDNLSKIIAKGADMVAFSGGKGIQGPQGTGILAGKKHLIDAAMANMLSFDEPKANIGRPMKVTKEEIIGLLTALEIFVDTDQDTVWAKWNEKSTTIVKAAENFIGIEGQVVVAPDRQGPVAVFNFTSSWDGPTIKNLLQELRDGDPSIWLQGNEKAREIAVVPVNIQDGEEVTISIALRKIFHKYGTYRS
tara:strand:- start:592 stop:1770 length:1179 start_codon:yes stop_codon:yes gene_type:complete